VNFVKCRPFIACISEKQIALGLFLTTLLLPIYLVGCSDQVTLPTTEQLVEFENAGPLRPAVDIDRLVKAKIGGGPYEVAPGDVLELTLPAILQAVTDEQSGMPDQVKPYPFRVTESGTINLSIVGEIKVAGKTLSQIESAIIDAYYPAYAVTRPSVFVRVAEYKTVKVSVSGAVQKPGIYSLRSDQMSLVALLMEAGGIVDDGATVIRISHRDQVMPINKEATPKPLVPSKTKQVKFSSRYPGSNNEVKIQLHFQQEAPLSTIGILTIRQDEKRLLTDQIDLADKRERLLLLDKLARNEPIALIVEVEQKLNELKESLKAEFGKYNEYIVSDSNIDLTNLLTASSSLGQNLTQAESQNVNASLEQKLTSQARRKLFEYRQGAGDSQQDKTVNVNISSNPEFPRDRSQQNSTLDDALNQEASKIAGRNRKPGTERITNQDTLQEPETLVLPIRGLNIPFADIALQDGDSVIVERMELPLFSVIGLVSRPGNFPYPPDVQYNLMQALAFAGGFNLAADPRYASVYRLKPDGTIASAIFKLVNVGKGLQFTDSLNVHIKPGDIVAVEHTPRTRTKLFLDSVFRINIGTYLRLEDLYN